MKRGWDQEIEELIDGEIMEWDLQDFVWESSTTIDHHHHHHNLELDPKQDDLVLHEFTPPQQSQSCEGNTTGSNGEVAPRQLFGGAGKRVIGAQKMRCLVDGCNADLTGCREYHKRHRVCEKHSKTPIVVVKGEPKRFCQQCSRFHSLGEFDEVKRSCRKRLDGHNRRRRKSHPEPLYFSSKNFLSGYKGPRILHFGNPQIYATANVKTALWPIETKPESESWLYSPQASFNGKNLGVRGNDHRPNSTSDQFLSYNNERRTQILMSSSSDEEISLPIDSGGRALYLLSNNQTPQPNQGCSAQLLLDYDDPTNKPVLDHFQTSSSYFDVANKTAINNDYNNNNNSDANVYGALQMLPISLE